MGVWWRPVGVWWRPVGVWWHPGGGVQAEQIAARLQPAPTGDPPAAVSAVLPAGQNPFLLGVLYPTSKTKVTETAESGIAN